jgi:hypothetical protein
VIEKKFSSGKFANAVDSSIFEVHRSGDLLEVDYKRTPIILEKIEADNIHMFLSDYWFDSKRKGTSVIVSLELKRD